MITVGKRSNHCPPCTIDSFYTTIVSTTLVFITILINRFIHHNHHHNHYNYHHHNQHNNDNDHNHDIKGLGALPSPRLGICPRPSSQLAMNARSTTIPHCANHYNTKLCRPLQYHTAQTITIAHCAGHYTTTLCKPLQYHTKQAFTIPHSAGHYNTTQCRPLQHHTVQAITIPHCAGHYNATLLTPIPDIRHFLYTDRTVEFQILHRKIPKNTPPK